MSYADLISSDQYVTKHAGAGLEALILDEENPARRIVGATTGLNISLDYEAVDIEEAGNEKPSEYVQGRVSPSCTLQAFWTPEWGDNLPSTQLFLGRRYLVLVRIGPRFPQAGTVVDAVTGCVLTRLGKAHGARGARTVDMAFKFAEHFTGSEWAAITGA